MKYINGKSQNEKILFIICLSTNHTNGGRLEETFGI